ncbi:tandem-95 repeat protein, partial [Vibrio vulnificus]|uniref:Ig-like domain-containing protein n=1 Tax=Vibrio vulnificus TaxID=672 RepID=UPI0019D47AF9
MDFTAFLAGASLTAGRIVVLDLNGNIKILAPGQAIAPGELVIETLEETDVPQFRIATDAGETNITDDIQQIFAALEEGQDPTQLGDDFATAAGETGGSSLVAGGTISRTGAESLASTDFSTQGLQALGLSETQSLALASQIRAFNEQITIVEPTPDDDRPTVSSISSFEVAEGESATFDVTLSNASTTATTVTLTLAGDSATAGTDFTDTEVTVTYKDGTTQTVAVNGDGTFVITVPAGDTHFSVSVQTTDDGVYEGDETFTLSGQTAAQSTAMTGTATLKDDGSVTPPDGTSDDDRPAVSSISSPIVSEGESATFEVNLSNASTTATTVTLTLAGDSATAGTDFTDTEVTVTYKDGTTQTVAVNGDGTFVITVPAGDTHFSVSVQTNDDGVYEGDETFTLSGKTATQSTTMTGTATLKDDGSVTPPDGTSDDDRPVVSSISSPIVSEGDSATFEVNLSNASTTATTVTLTLAGDSATAGTDFTDTEVTVTYKDGNTETVAVNGDGTFVITVPAGDTKFSVSVETTDDDVFEGNETFTLSGKTGSQEVLVTATGTIVDDAVDAVNDEYQVNEDGSVSMSLLANDKAPDGGLAIVSVNGVTLTGGAQSIEVTNGSVEIAADGSMTFKPSENFNGDISFDYVARDADGDTDTATVSIKVESQNDAVDAVNDSYEVNEDGSVTLTLLANDKAPDGGLAIKSLNGVELTGLAQSIAVQGGNVVIAADGSISFVPGKDFNGDISFNYVAQDADGDTDTATLSITVTEDNTDVANDAITVAEDTV